MDLLSMEHSLALAWIPRGNWNGLLADCAPNLIQVVILLTSSVYINSIECSLNFIVQIK